MKLFGKAGAELLPLFAGGAGSIKEATDEAQRFGMALTGAQGRDVEAMNDSFSKVSAAISGIVKQITAYLAPSITAIATTFTDFVGSMGGANIGQAIGEGIIGAAQYLAGIGDSIIGGLSAVGEFFMGVGVSWSSVFDAVGRYASMWAGVGRTLAGVFLTMVGGAAGILGLISKTAKDISNRLITSARDNFSAAGQNFDNAFGPGGKPAAGSGPLSAALEAALAKSRLSAGQVDQAGKATIAPGAGAIAVARNQEVKAIDSRSKEGIAEMFRLMRGDANDPAERTAKATERIADNTDDMGLDIEELSFAG